MTQAILPSRPSPPPPAQHQHGVAFEFFPGGQRMPEGKDALVGGDEVDDSLYATTFCFTDKKPSDLVLGLARPDGPHSAVHRLGTQLAQRSKACALFGGQVSGIQGKTAFDSLVLALVEEREAARARRDWAAADALRERIATLGWHVIDTPTGPSLQPLSEKLR